MKRTILLLAALLLLIGCQKTPEQPLIVPKEQQVMVEKATTAQESEAEAAPMEAPARWTFSTQDQNFTYTIDADVVVPEGPLPMVWVRAQGISQEKAYDLFHLLSYGEEMRLPRERTKAEIEKDIRHCTELIEKGPDKDADMTREEFEQGLLDELEYLKKAYEAAPETSENRITDGTYETRQGGRFDATRLILDANNRERELNIYTCPNADDMSSLSYYRHLWDREVGYSMIHAQEVGPASPLPDGLDYNKIIDQVNEVLQVMGPGLEIATVFLIDDAADGSTDGIIQDGSHYALCVDCRRRVKGVSVAAPSSSISRSDNVYSIPWQMEALRFVVDAEGIVSINWFEPLTVLDTLSESTSLLSFENIRDVVEKMLPIVYNPAGREHLKSLEVNVSHVRLELIRVREQNNTQELKGLLIPAWVFYGTLLETESDGWKDYATYGLSGGYDYYQGDEIILCLNAVDGSVIDPLLGY